MRDRDVRDALRRKILSRHYKDAATIVVDELGISHGTSRIDIAVVNGRLHGFEIKSEADTLERLPAQATSYSNVFDYITIVCGEKHLNEVKQLIPSWWGIKVTYSGTRGAVHFRQVRYPRLNKHISPMDVARLLWRDEVLKVLSDAAGLTRGLKNKSREALYMLLISIFPLKQLCALVRDTLKSRVGWRSDAIRIPYDGSLLPCAM